MAHMYPARLRIETKSEAERKLYDLLREGLSDDYVVFHGISWLVRDLRGDARDGEADFVVVHPERGIVVIEVKGGSIRYDGETGEWFSNQYLIKDPFGQARRNKYNLMAKLNELAFWQNRRVAMGHAVGFPDVVVKHDLRLDAPKEIILDAGDLFGIQRWVERVMAYWQSTDPRSSGPGPTGVQELVRLLSPQWELRSSLAAEFLGEEATIIRLTEEQFNLLDFLSGHRRVAISGCAGSGKTTMAVEQARRLAREGFRVLLTCFNRHLADYLHADKTLPDSVEVGHFHGICSRMVLLAGFKDRLKIGAEEQEWYDQTLPELLMEAATQLGARYDAVVVDEGQDFQSHWWIPLQCLLQDPEHGIFYVFYDDNQNIYQADVGLPPDLQRFTLRRNCRNTQQIHRAFLPFYRSGAMPIAIGPVGRSPEIRRYSSLLGLKKNLSQALHRLVVNEGVAPKDIVVLTPRSRDNSALWKWEDFANLRLSDKRPPGSGKVYCTSVYGFKGLESPVVILAELGPSTHQDLEALLYVGCSRARNHLIVLADEALPDTILSRLVGHKSSS